VDWFKNPIPTPDAFEEGNMANISPTIKIDISVKPGIIEEITLDAACSPEEVQAYKALFQEFRDIFPGPIHKCLGLDPTIVEHQIDTWPDVALFAKRNDHYTLQNPWLSKMKSTSCILQGSFTPLHTLLGSQTLSQSTRNKEPFRFAPISETSIKPVPKTNFQPPSSIK
jgi:hypothetical protein